MTYQRVDFRPSGEILMSPRIQTQGAPPLLTDERLKTLDRWTRDRGHMARILRMGYPVKWDDLGRALRELTTLREEYAELKARMDGLEK